MSTVLPIFYINLDDRPDRRAFMERQFERLGLDARRMSAVRVSTLGEADLERYCNPQRLHFLTRSQLACTRSHTECWRALLETGAPWGLVHEDDAILSPRLPAFLEAFVASDAARAADLVQLETIARRTRMLPPIATVGPGFRLRPFRSEIWGTAGYLISADAARRLLARNDIFDRPTDSTLFRPYVAPARDFRLLLADPALCVQVNKVEASGIAAGNVSGPAKPPKPPLGTRWERLRREMRRRFLNISDHLSHLPRGLKSEIVPFDTPEKVYKGLKVTDGGTEILD